MMLTYEKLPTVQEMLKTCSHERMAEILVCRYVAAGGRRRERIRARYMEVMERMCEIVVKNQSGIVLVPRVRFSFGPAFAISRIVTAVCVDVNNHGGRLGGIGIAPWEQVLSYRVWTGADACLRDCYDLIADACWHMANAGTTAQEARSRAALRPGELLESSRFGRDDKADCLEVGCFEGRDAVDDEYREVLNELIAGWNADADIAFYAETLAMRRCIHAA